MFRRITAALLVLALCLSAALALADGGWYCPKCGRYNEADYKYCPKDGTKKPTDLGNSGGKTVSAEDNYTKYAKVKAKANRRLATRTGPGTVYDEPGSFNKAGTKYKVLSKAYDYDNGIWWVQVEIKVTGGVIWAYTGVKRFDDLDLKQIPEEKVIGKCRISSSITGYYAPPDAGGTPIKRKVPGGVSCSIYGYAYGEGSDYIQVEFYDSGLGQYRRAWVPDPFVDDYEMYNGF